MARTPNGFALQHRDVYRVWEHIKDRCLNPNSASFARYGGRGITVCERWRESFINFFSDVGERPANPEGWGSRRPYWTLDRIDNDGPYTPENCRWANPTQQILNSTNHVALLLRKETCPYGHRYTQKRWAGGRLRRICGECERIRHREAYKRNPRAEIERATRNKRRRQQKVSA